jgi:hypothetical protein
MGIGGTAELSNIQVLIIDTRRRPSGSPLVGQLVSRVRAVRTVKDQNLFRLYCPPGPQGLRKRKGWQQANRDEPKNERHDAFMPIMLP